MQKKKAHKSNFHALNHTNEASCTTKILNGILIVVELAVSCKLIFLMSIFTRTLRKIFRKQIREILHYKYSTYWPLVSYQARCYRPLLQCCIAMLFEELTINSFIWTLRYDTWTRENMQFLFVPIDCKYRKHSRDVMWTVWMIEKQMFTFICKNIITGGRCNHYVYLHY